jgi:hypothetical protein
MLAAVPERPKIADAPLSVVLLARSGDAEAQAVAQDWLAWLAQRPGDAELLLIHDADEATPENSAPRDPRRRDIHQVAPPGIGPCLQTGIWLARHPLLLTAPCDRQYRPADLQRLFDQIDQVDLVAGCRVHRPPPAWLRALGFVRWLLTIVLLGYGPEPRASWLGWGGFGRRWRARHILGVKVQDAECPVRLYRTEVLRRFPIQARGSFAHVEVLAKANHLGCLMAEIPMPWTPPANLQPDATWAADYKTVKRRPDFGPPLLPTGTPANDLLASDHGSKPGNLSAPSKLGG